MKIKELKVRISLLRGVYSNAMKIQKYCLKNSDEEECIKKLEEEAELNTTLHNFASATASYIADEIKRLEDIIENTEVEIN